MSDFAPPAPPGNGIKFEPLNGRLLLIEVVSFEPKVKTSFGENDAVRADVHVLDGPDAGSSNIDTLVFPKVLVGQLKGSVGGKVLGRLGQGQQKPGQSPPWLLSEATAEDGEVAKRFLASQVGSPSTPAATPATSTSDSQVPF